MENSEEIFQSNGSNKKTGKSCIKSCLIIILILIGFIISGFAVIYITNHIPRSIDISENGKYVIELQAIGSPGWPFGPQNGRIVLKNNNRKIHKEKFVLHNDGKNMNKNNWNVKWESDKVVVTIIGEEQEDEIFILHYNGEIERINSDLS